MIAGDGSFRSVTLSDLEEIAEALAGTLGKASVLLFRGEMGAGKTSLIKALCKRLGVTETTSSPTFSIVNEYEAVVYDRLFHFDFYRIKNELEAIDIGTEEYFYSGFPCFVEWPEKIPSLIPLQYVEISIQIETDTKRTIAIAVHDGKKENRI